MLLIQYVLTSIVVSLGLAFGATISKYTIEELKDGLKYVKASMLALLYLNIFLATKTISDNIFIMTIIPTIIVLLVFYTPKLALGFTKDYLFIIILACCLFFQLKSGLEYIFPFLIFFNLLLIGSVMYFRQIKEKNQNIYFSFIIKIVIYNLLTFGSYFLSKII